MKRMIKRFGKLTTASFIIMGIGVVTFLLTPVFLLIGADTDLLGILILDIGVVIYIIELIRRKKPNRLKLVALFVLISVLGIPILFSIISLIYYLITGKLLEI
jgi:predicted membrane channel-forming protein YqfA (hemolysin III family)